MTRWVLLFVLLVPVVAAAPGLHVLSYEAFVLVDSPANGAIAQTDVVLDEAHTWTHIAGQSILTIKTNYRTVGAIVTPTADYEVRWNGTAIEHCEWRIVETGGSSARNNIGLEVDCLLSQFALPGNHTVELARTANTGEPVTGSTISITLHQQETVSMDITITSTLDFWIPLLFWLAVLVAALYMDWLWVAGFSIPGLLVHLFPDQIPGDFEQYLVFAILGVVMEYFAFRRRRKSGLTT